jgi:hypothetical protein
MLHSRFETFETRHADDRRGGTRGKENGMMQLAGKTGARRIVVVGLALLAAGLLLPAAATAESATETAVRQAVEDSYSYSRENLKDLPETNSKHGTASFWSSGGLMWEVPANPPASEYDHFSLWPKHIKVLSLVEDQAAVALYYAEGSFQVKGNAPVDHYMTRVMEVWVQEDGKWKVRAAHWSPIAAGAGTNQTSLD